MPHPISLGSLFLSTVAFVLNQPFRHSIELTSFKSIPDLAQNKLNQCKQVDPEGSRGHGKEGTRLEAPLPSLWLLNINMKPVSLLCYIPRRRQPAAGQCQAITPQSLHASTALGHVKPGASEG